MAYKKINGTEVIERGGSIVSVAWLKSKSEGEAVRGRTGVDRNNTVAMWKEVHGYSVPNPLSRFDEIMKLSKPAMVEMAEGLEIDFESDANKKTIANMIVDKEKEAQD